MTKRICIIGGGNGAFAAAADLTLRGFTITMYCTPKHAHGIQGLLQDDDPVIHVVGVGPQGDAHIHKVTTDLDEALEDVDLIMPILPANSQEETAKELAPHLKEGSIICLAPGSCGGALVYAKVFHDLGVYDKVKICEMNTLPYATRLVDDHTVNILLEVKCLYFAAFPAKYNEELYPLVKEAYPAIELVTDVMEVALNNGNITTHAAPVVLNAGKIEYTGGPHYHYKEGITPSVAHVNEDIDAERLAICRAFGYKEVGAIERNYLAGYTAKCDTLYESYQSSKDIYMKIEGPNDLNGRYLTEDAPMSLVFCSDLSGVAGLVDVKTPIMDSVCYLASSLKQENYFSTGRTLEKIGLAGKTKEETLAFLQEGY